MELELSIAALIVAIATAVIGFFAYRSQHSALTDARSRWEEEAALLSAGLDQAQQQWELAGPVITVKNGSRQVDSDRRNDVWWVEVGNAGRMATTIAEVQLMDMAGGYPTSLSEVSGVSKGFRIEPGESKRLESTRGGLADAGYNPAKTWDRWWLDAVVRIDTGDGSFSYWANDGRANPQQTFF